MSALIYETDAERVRDRLADPSVPLIACLCAAWCGSCRDYLPVFEDIANAHPELCFVWVDIEEQADRLDDFDVENFPTLVLSDAKGVRFSGAVLPHAGILKRLLAEREALPATPLAPDLRACLLSD